jgi:hypothetical protein
MDSIPDKKQNKLVNAALSLTSGEGATELRHFLYDTRATDAEKSENLVRDKGCITP